MARSVGRPKKDNHEKYLDEKAKVEEILSLHGPRDASEKDFLSGVKFLKKKITSSIKCNDSIEV